MYLSFSLFLFVCVCVCVCVKMFVQEECFGDDRAGEHISARDRPARALPASRCDEMEKSKRKKKREEKEDNIRKHKGEALIERKRERERVRVQMERESGEFLRDRKEGNPAELAAL